MVEDMVEDVNLAGQEVPVEDKEGVNKKDVVAVVTPPKPDPIQR